MRAAGLDYMEIARRGGGIHSSVRDLRTRSEDELFELARARLRRLASHGTTTVEVKSGYGLTLEDELKTLRVIARLRRELPAAHRPDLPRRARDPARASRLGRDRRRVRRPPHSRDDTRGRRASGWRDSPTCSARPASTPWTRAARFSPRRATRGCSIKLHADELTSSGGAELAAELGAVSADHLAAISDAGIDGAGAGTNRRDPACRERCSFSARPSTRRPAASSSAGVPVALATDFNPGTSPTPNLPLGADPRREPAARLSVAEVVIAATVNGAAAWPWPTKSGRSRRAISPTSHCSTFRDVRAVPYWYGDNCCAATFVRGKPCHSSDLGLTPPAEPGFGAVRPHRALVRTLTALMSNVAKLKKQAAEFEPRSSSTRPSASTSSFSKAFDANPAELDVALFNRVGDLLLRQGNVADAVDYYERGDRPVRRHRLLQQRDRALQQGAPALARPRARSTTSSEDQRQEGLQERREANFLEYADRMQKAGKVDEAFRALEGVRRPLSGSGRDSPDARRAARASGPQGRRDRAVAGRSTSGSTVKGAPTTRAPSSIACARSIRPWSRRKSQSRGNHKSSELIYIDVDEPTFSASMPGGIPLVPPPADPPRLVEIQRDDNPPPHRVARDRSAVGRRGRGSAAHAVERDRPGHLHRRGRVVDLRWIGRRLHEHAAGRAGSGTARRLGHRSHRSHPTSFPEAAPKTARRKSPPTFATRAAMSSS